MTRILSVFLVYLIFGYTNAPAQIYDPVTWTFDVKRTAPDEADLIIKAKIEDKWHLYSQFLPSDDGPIATSFNFDESKNYKRIGKVKESESITEYDKVNMMELTFFEHQAVFTQSVKILSDKPFKISGFLEFMVCDDKKCLPPESIDFDFPEIKPVAKLMEEKVKKPAGKIIEDSQITTEQDQTETDPLTPENLEEPVIYDPVKWSFSVNPLEENTYELLLTAEMEEGWHLYSQKLPEGDGPIPTSFRFNEQEGMELQGEIVAEGELISEYDPNFMMDLDYYKDKVVFKQKIKVDPNVAVIRGDLEYMTCNDKMCLPPELVEFSIDLLPVNGSEKLKEEDNDETGLSFWGTFLKGFAGGLLALLTPCVFPMIPLTVSFFTKQSKTRAKGISNAITYGLSIIGIYVLLGFGITVLFGADALNALSTNVWFNLAFFVLLVVFAISFFGAFEITLPSSWVNKADQASDKGGLLGIFFMAFTLSMVSFSCTGPIIGTLLVDAAVNGGVSGPLIGMFGFSAALALPFALFAAFPGWLNTLPKSGGWLNSVKVVLGFLELAFAFKFLSNADLVIQAGLLKREIFLAIWIAIFMLMTFYLLGFYRLPHDSESKNLSVTRLMFATASLFFTIYLIPGLWGAPLKFISGFPPPMFYSESPNGVGAIATISQSALTDKSGEIVGDPDHCPHNLPCFHDYEEGLAYAKEAGKPVMLDFTGWACVNCRKMEEQVWSDPRVLKRLREDFVLISLYVDEKLKLPEEEQKEVMIGDKKKKLRTVGNKWSYFQASRYKTNSQPYYVLLDHKEEMLNEPAAYDPDIEKFIEWLDEGRKDFGKR